MKTVFALLALLITTAIAFLVDFKPPPPQPAEAPPPARQEFREITGQVKKGETLFDIFQANGLDIGDLYQIRAASAKIHGLGNLHPDRPYRITLDDRDQLRSFAYRIDDDCFLNIDRTADGFCAERILIPYQKKIEHIGGTISDHLIASIGEGKENLLLALQLSDIFAWDIDFTTDLRKGDSYKIVVEGLYLQGQFKKYGEILAAEFSNNGRTYLAYGFSQNGKTDYYDETGKPLRKSFLRSPLNFRQISSGFSKKRRHPILKIARPHHGIDYAAATGTPVSAAGEGTILFAGLKGQYGKLVIIGHRNGYKTYYGHLSRFGKGIRNGAKIGQGKVIGYVGATGLATGPHLHYEMRINDRPVNPMSQKVPLETAISGAMLADFRDLRERMDALLVTIKPSNPVAVSRPETGEQRRGG